MDPREDIELAFEEPERRTTISPPPLRHLTEVPAPAPPEPQKRRARPPAAPTPSGVPAPPDTSSAPDSAAAEVPGRARGRLRYLELYLTGRAHELLTAQRDVGQTFGVAAAEAVRRSRHWLVETYAPPPADPDDDFPPPRRSKRRFQVDGGRHVSVGVTDEEAEAIARLAVKVDLNASQLVSEAVEHHFGGGT